MTLRSSARVNLRAPTKGAVALAVLMNETSQLVLCFVLFLYVDRLSQGHQSTPTLP
jgi:hypothetical protein